MKVPKPWWILAAVGLGLIALLPLAAQRFRGRPAEACALDGMQVEHSLRVRIVDASGAHQFCSLACAELWLEASGAQPAAIYVTDETTGRELEATSAHYVRSSIVAHARTQERRHVFAREADAEAHGERFHGRILEGPQRPFQGQTAEPP